MKNHIIQCRNLLSNQKLNLELKSPEKADEAKYQLQQYLNVHCILSSHPGQPVLNR